MNTLQQPKRTGAVDSSTIGVMIAAGDAWRRHADPMNGGDPGFAVMHSDQKAGSVAGYDSNGVPVRARKRRWDVADDVEMTPSALRGLRDTYQYHRMGSSIHLGADASYRDRNGGFDVMEQYPTVEHFLQNGWGDDRAVEALMPKQAMDAPGLYVHLDLVLQLPDLVEKSRVPTTARALLPFHNFNAPGATDYEYRVTERRGRAEFTANFDGRAPDSDRDIKPIRRPLKWMWSGASWTWQDIQNAAQARANGTALPNLESDELETAHQNCMILEDLTMWMGNKDIDLHGVLSDNAQTLIPRTNAVKNFSDETISPEEMLETLRAAERRVFLTRFEKPDTIALGTADYAKVHQTDYDTSNSSNRTVAEHFLATSMWVKNIVWAPLLDYVSDVENELRQQGYGPNLAAQYAGGINQLPAMLCYRRSPDVIRGIIGVDLQVMPTEQAQLKFYTPVLLKTGGLEVKRPRACDLTLFPPVP